MVHGIGGNNPIFNFNGAGKANHVGKSNEVKTSQPIDLVRDTAQIDRKDLDKLSPYAGLVQISHKAPVGSVESYMAAAPELASWTGNFGISNDYKDEAVSLLGAYALASQDFGEVSGNLQKTNSPFTELFA